MKLLAFLLSISLATVVKGQLLTRSLDVAYRPFKLVLNNGVERFISYETAQRSIAVYDANLAFVERVTLPAAATGDILSNSAIHVSDRLFDTDDGLEIMVSVNTYSTDKKVYVIDNGSVAQVLDGAGPSRSSSEGFVFHVLGGVTYAELGFGNDDTRLYRCPGRLPVGMMPTVQEPMQYLVLEGANPVSNFIAVRTGSHMQEEVEVLDVAGHVVAHSTSKKGHAEVSVRHLAAGAYLVRCGTKSVAFVKEDN